MLMDVIAQLLEQCLDNIKAGTSNISEEDQLEIVEMLRKYTDKDRRLSKYQACIYLNMSRATFDNYVREGKIPKGKKEIGWKELSWSESELKEVIKQFRR